MSRMYSVPFLSSLLCLAPLCVSVADKPDAAVEELSGPLDAVNTADEPARVAPRSTSWTHGMAEGRASYAFPPRSFTVIRFE